MRQRYFQFKQFSVSHAKSAMKVGIDGVLLGSWFTHKNYAKILDVGCGCGLIALMAAQRCENAAVIAIDIDKDSIDETKDNIARSNWRNRVFAKQIDFIDYAGSIINDRVEKFNLIISNPPFYDSGVTADLSARTISRHISINLSPTKLIEIGHLMLAEGGVIAMICPDFWYEQICKEAKRCNMFMSRLTKVRGNESSPVKRLLIELTNKSCETMVDEITIECARGEYTNRYKELTAAFYLKF